MEFDLERSVAILKRTPKVLRSLLEDLDSDFINLNEGPDTWSPFDIIGHLIHGEKTDWISRTELIQNSNTDKTFAPFDRFAQFEASKGKSIDDLLDEFERLREANLQKLLSLNITIEDLDKTGIHPALGRVTLRELLSTWVTHDLGHLAQTSRVLSKQYKNDSGPWIEYISVLNR